MKLRSDFVSNSSSSSFILSDCNLTKYFRITKQMLVEVLIELYGGKDKFEANCKRLGNYNYQPFYVYDMKDPKDARKAHKKWDKLLDQWDSEYVRVEPITGDIVSGNGSIRCESVLRSISEIFGIVGLRQGTKYELKGLTIFIPSKKKDKKTGRYGKDIKVPNHIMKTIKDIRKKSGVMTHKDVLYLTDSRFLVHFEENEIHFDEFSKLGKEDQIHSWTSKKDIRKIKNSKYDSESCSSDRIIELIFKFWYSKGYINPNERDFLKLFPQTEYQKKYAPESKHSTVNGKTYTWRDFKWSLAAFCGHEG